MRALVLLLVLGCGRIGIDPADHVPDPDGPIDVAAATCPADTRRIAPDATVCIEQVERGSQPWTVATEKCGFFGRRLCTDVEWATACDQATGLVDMFDDQDGQNWEWVADVLPNGEGGKRGLTACGDMSSHEILVDPYDFRCCVDI